MTKRFTSGGFGRLDFATVNRMLEASDKVEGMPLAPSRQERKSPRDTVIGRLTRIEDDPLMGGTGRIEGLPYRNVYLWDWQEIEVVPAAVAGTADPAIKTKLYGSGTAILGPRRGRAFCLNGVGYEGDIVVLHRVSSALDPNSTLEPESYWCFYETHTIPDTFVGLITQYDPTTEEYKVKAHTYDDLGGNAFWFPQHNSKWLDNRLVRAINLSTQVNIGGTAVPRHHGQKMTFSPPNDPAVQLSTDGHVKGVVTCTLLSSRALLAIAGVEPLYGFDVPNPVSPQCI